MKMPIHTEIISVLENQINQDQRFKNLSPYQYQKLIKELINLWYFIYTQQQNEIEVNLRYFVNIHKQEFQQFRIQVKNDDYKHAKLIEILKDCKLIFVNDWFKPKSFSKGYKINTSFLVNSNYTEFEIDFEKIFKKTKSKQHWLDLYPEHKHLIEDVYLSSINLDEYLYWLRNNLGKELKMAKKKIEKDGKKSIIFQRQVLTPERIDQYFFKALKLNFKNVWFAVSKEGRFYNTVSNLPSTAVPFLKIDNKDTVEIDIANSQPLLLSVLLSANQKCYKEDVQDGKFYQKVADFMGISRSKFKQISYQFIFFNDKPLKSGKTYCALELLYPGLIKEINEIKSKTKLACQLQAMEAAIFVAKIGVLPVRKLLRHDQAVVTLENLEIVKKELINEYKNIGLKVSF